MFVSADQVVGLGDIEVANYSNDFSYSIAVGLPQGVSFFPGATTPLLAGDYFLLLALDADHQLAETDESNNLLVQPFTVLGADSTTRSAPNRLNRLGYFARRHPSPPRRTRRVLICLSLELRAAVREAGRC